MEKNREISRRTLFVAFVSVAGAAVLGKFLIAGKNGIAKVKALISSPKVEGMPNTIKGELIDWRARSKAAYGVLFDFEAVGPNMPVIWNDTERRHINETMFALPAYLGDYRQNPAAMGSHESLSGIGSVLGASLYGLDMSNHNGRNFTHELLGYFQGNGIAKVVTNQTADSGSQASFWYLLYPNIAFYAVNSLYLDEPGYKEASIEIADELLEMMEHLKKIDGKFSFNFPGYNFLTKSPTYGGSNEPDAAAGTAWILYIAYLRFGEEKYFTGAKKALDYLESLTDEENPFFEVLLAFGVTIAARMNLEKGTNYNYDKYFAWIFEVFSSARSGWGIISDTWGMYHVHGLQGSTVDSGGYAFAFNSYNLLAALAPLPIYAPEYTQVIGKWLFNSAVSARLFYPDQLPADNQTQPDLIGLYDNGLAYEGLRKEWAFKFPVATADARRMTWASTDIGIYGSGLVGVLAGLISSIESNGIIVFEISKTDFFPTTPTPRFLAYNSSETTQTYKDHSLLSGESVLI